MSRFPPRNAPDIAFSWSCCSWVWNQNYIIRTISLSFDFYDKVFALSSSLLSKSYQMSIFNIFDTIPASIFISIYSTFISTCSWRLVSSSSRHLALHLDNDYDHSYHCYYYFYNHHYRCFHHHNHYWLFTSPSPPPLSDIAALVWEDDYCLRKL